MPAFVRVLHIRVKVHAARIRQTRAQHVGTITDCMLCRHLAGVLAGRGGIASMRRTAEQYKTAGMSTCASWQGTPVRPSQSVGSGPMQIVDELVIHMHLHTVNIKRCNHLQGQRLQLQQ